MPTVSIDRGDLFEALGNSYTEQELDELCFDYGLELDDWVEDEGERPTVKIEIPANRYDMLCTEGIARALAIYLGKQSAPSYKVVVPENPVTLTIDPSVAQIRPYACGAILRGVTFTQRRYDSFIALQDKLHANLCRNRSLVAIGTHDLSKITGNVRYQGVVPAKVNFRPLNQAKTMGGAELLEHYRQDRHLAKFVPLIENSPVLPLFTDETGQVLSLPPLINSDETKIKLETKDIFFDLTATDKTKLEIVVNELVAMFSEFASEPWSIEAVKVVYTDGSIPTKFWPNMTPSTLKCQVSYLNSVLGLEQTASDYKALLKRMALDVTDVKGDEMLIELPVTRPDVLHACDIVEDAGIGYGFNRLKRTFPGRSATIGAPLPINKVSDILRLETAEAGWLEVMPLTLCSLDENFGWLRRVDDGKAVHLANPKTLEYQVVRTTLLPGLLKTIRENRRQALPLKIFESGDVAFKDESLERQSRNERHFAAVYAGQSSGFEITQGLLDWLMRMLRYAPEEDASRRYWLEEASEAECPQYFPGRAAKIMIQDTDGSPVQAGTLGTLHPEVLNKFNVPFVCSSFEINSRLFLSK